MLKYRQEIDEERLHPNPKIDNHIGMNYFEQ